MNNEKDPRTYWPLLGKGLFLLSAIGVASVEEGAVSAPFVLFVLLYACAAIASSLPRAASWRTGLSAAPIAVVLAAAVVAHPALLLLLPIQLCELAANATHNRWAAALLLLAPLPYVPERLWFAYGLAAAFSLLFVAMLDELETRSRTDRIEAERFRRELERVRTRLDEQQDYVRQFEYTYALEERNRLSQQIHDSIGHSIAGALIQMEAAKRLLDADREKSAELLGNAIRISKEGIDDIRRVLKGAKPPAEQLGIQRMKLFIDEFAAAHPIKTAFTYEGDVDLIPPVYWKIIRENVKEALTNAMKYAGAASVSVHVQVLNTMVKAVVSDDGKGAPRVVKGLGLIGMEERAASANGTVVADGSRGFTVTTLLPFSERT
ncbi:histidine kinase [Paenibacillus sp.]|uniref:sensor histidine kinase n=1 Tax=Paenibacillus sp. TaxID=58172 RepID=UPI002811838F|nr:histidine kinase [Paenibacillus sp.]